VQKHYFGVEILAGYSSTLSVIGVAERLWRRPSRKK